MTTCLFTEVYSYSFAGFARFGFLVSLTIFVRGSEGEADGWRGVLL
jgi:hypothetical protein